MEEMINGTAEAFSEADLRAKMLCRALYAASKIKSSNFIRLSYNCMVWLLRFNWLELKYMGCNSVCNQNLIY
jgi:hypothetical protein